MEFIHAMGEDKMHSYATFSNKPIPEEAGTRGGGGGVCVCAAASR